MTSTTDDYTFLVTNMLTGDIVDEVDLASYNFTEVLNRPGGGQATARLDVPSTTEENFLPWGNALWALKGNQVISAGMIGAAQPRSGSRVLNVPIHGFMEYYRTQPIQAFGTNLWAHGVQLPDEPGHSHRGGVRFSQVEQFEIFQDIIEHVGRRDQLSNLDPFVTWANPSGILRDETWWNYEYKFVGVALEQFADRIDGFLWDQVYAIEGNKLRFGFRLRYPTSGTDRYEVLEYTADPEQTNVWGYDFDAPTRPASSVIAVGEGQGPDAIRARIDTISNAFGAFTGGRPRYYEVLNFSDIKNTSTLQDHAGKFLERHLIPVQSATVELTPNTEPYFLSFNMADTMPLRIDDHGIQVDKRYRVVTRQLALTKEADELVTLGLEQV